MTCTLRADSLDIAVECVLALAGGADVIEPAEVRERVARSARAALARLEGGAPGP